MYHIIQYGGGWKPILIFIFGQMIHPHIPAILRPILRRNMTKRLHCSSDLGSVKYMELYQTMSNISFGIIIQYRFHNKMIELLFHQLQPLVMENPEAPIPPKSKQPHVVFLYVNMSIWYDHSSTILNIWL